MTAVCAIDGCDQPVNARGWCGKHYQRWRKTGTTAAPEPPPPPPPPPGWLTSRQVCGLLDITYRQLNYAAVTVLELGLGSGNRLLWKLDTVARLAAAKALLGACGWRMPTSPWPHLLRIVADGPPPTPGWVHLAPDGHLSYHADCPTGAGLTAPLASDGDLWPPEDQP